MLFQLTPFIELFETSRLIASRMRVTDFDDLYSMYRDPTIMASLGGMRSEEEIDKTLVWNMQHWDIHGYGLWIFRDKISHQFLGRGGLRSISLEGQVEIEVAYSLIPAFWGKGYATEIAAAALKVGFDILHLSQFICTALVSNKQSQRVMEKLGFSFERYIIREHLEQVLYRLSRDDYQNFLPQTSVMHSDNI